MAREKVQDAFSISYPAAGRKHLIQDPLRLCIVLIGAEEEISLADEAGMPVRIGKQLINALALFCGGKARGDRPSNR